MAERKNTHGLELVTIDRTTIVSIGDMEIWDGADLSLIRDTLFRLIRQQAVNSISIDMKYVQYIPSGFFGMLYDWMDRGIEVRLLHPRTRVQQMLWFQKFFVDEGHGTHRLVKGTAPAIDANGHDWSVESTSSPVASPLALTN